MNTLFAFAADSQVYYVISPDFFGEYQNYTFLETLLYKQSEKQCFHLLQDLFGRHLGFYKMAAEKKVFGQYLSF